MPLDQASRRACYCDRLRLIFAGPATHPCQAQALAKKMLRQRPKNPFCVEFSAARRAALRAYRPHGVPGQQLYTSYVTAANCSHPCGSSGGGSLPPGRQPFDSSKRGAAQKTAPTPRRRSAKTGWSTASSPSARPASARRRCATRSKFMEDYTKEASTS